MHPWRSPFFLIVLCVFVHVLVLKAAFDIYLSSPIEHGTPFKSTEKPPAGRAVIIVSDGLRAKDLFGEKQEMALPNLTKLRKTRASWGVARTELPTVLLAGAYEHSASIFLGLSGNRNSFDSVINQSTFAWCWGGPQIAEMCSEDDLGHIHSYVYDSANPDFGLQVYDDVQTFIVERSNCEVYCLDFIDRGNVFFLHLSGRGFKPNSMEYYNNIGLVDKIIPKIEELFETAFPDDSTAYIFTSGSGVTDWVSEPANEIPFIAWGAGVKTINGQKDIKQVDIALLISALIGLNYPVNSIGTLPRDLIDTSKENLGEMLLSNVRQLLETYLLKSQWKMNNAYFHGFDKIILGKFRQLEDLLSDKKFAQFNQECDLVIGYLTQGAEYQVSILISVTIGFAAFIIYVAVFNIPVRRQSRVTMSTIKFIQIFIIIPAYLNVLIVLKAQKSSLLYYLYFLFPIGMIHALVRRYPQIVAAMKYIRRYGFKNTAKRSVLFLVGLRLLAESFYNRMALAVLMFVMGLAVYVTPSMRRHTVSAQKLAWLAATVFLGVLQLIPVTGIVTKFSAYMMGYGFWWITMDMVIVRQYEHPFYNIRLIEIVDLQHFFVKLTPLYTIAVQFEFIAHDSWWNVFAWIWALYPVVIIPCSSQHVFVRLTSIFVAFAPFCLMVTFGFEMFFLIIFVLGLYAWLTIENTCYGYEKIMRANFLEEFELNRRLTADDFRRGFFFVSFVFVGFIGTGSSFDPEWLRTTFISAELFTMANFLFLRILIPFIYTSCTYRAINIFHKASTLTMFCAVLVFLDLMLLELFFNLNNDGTWHEISTRLSCFIVMQLFVLALIMLHGVGYFLTTLFYRLRLNCLLCHF